MRGLQAIRRWCAPVVAAIIFAGLADAAFAASSTTTVTSSRNPSKFGQAVTFTTTVSGSTGGAPTGTVTFKNGSDAISGEISLDALGAGQPITGGGYHSCALTAAGGVKCWGLNEDGQLGDNTVAERHTPIDVSGLASGVVAVTAGRYYTCAVTAGGGVKCWGDNSFGQLGDGSITDRHTPVDVSGLANGVATIAAGSTHICALTVAGGVKCWGSAAGGSLGRGPNIGNNTRPGDVSGLTNGVIALAVGSEFSCALTDVGGVKCWGTNPVGNLGDSSTQNRDTPVDVTGLTSGVVAIAAGYSHACAVTSEGGVKCWGKNDGQLGDGTTTDRHTPVDVSGLSSGVARITAGGRHTCALMIAGGVKCWGVNVDGEMGDGSTTNRLTPVDVTGLADGIIVVSAGQWHNCALTAARAATCWAYNSHGQMGDNSTTQRNTPIAVSGFADGAAVAVSKATFTTSSFPLGSHDITAAYSGDGSHSVSTSAVLTQTVDKASSAVLLGANVASSKFGQSVTFTATLTAGATGLVTFKDDETTLATVALSGTTATYTTTALAVGGHMISVAYGGDASFEDSTSSSLSHTVTKAATTLTFAATPATVAPGGHILLKGTVHAPAHVTPTGKVTFKDGSVTIGEGTVSGGVGQFTVTPTSIGHASLTATYSGDSHLSASTATADITISAETTAQARSNKTTTGAQQYPAIAKLKSGYFVAWASNGQDTSGYGIYGQRYSETGAKAGTELHISTGKTGSQSLPKVGGLKAGGFIVTWQSAGQDGSSDGIYAQNFNSSGGKVGKEFKVNKTTSGAQNGPAIATLSGGGFVIAWTSNGQDKSGLGIYAQRYDAAAKAVGTEFKVNKTTSGAQSLPTVAALTNGGFMIAWQSDKQDKSGLGIYGQRYDKNGKTVGSEFVVNKTTSGAQSVPSAAGLNDGGFVVAFQGPDSSGLGVYARRFTSSGTTSGNDVRVNTTTAQDQSQPNVTAFSNGGYAVLWTSASQDGSGKGVYGQAYKSTGAKANVEFLINTTKTGDQSQPAAAGAASGTFMAAWTSRNASPALEDVYTARFQVR